MPDPITPMPDPQVSSSPGQRRASKLPRIAMGCCGCSLAAAIGLVLMFVLVGPGYYSMPSAAMDPTIIGGERILADRLLASAWDYRFHRPKSGDIVVYQSPKAADAEHLSQGLEPVEYQTIKRIIGVPGDTIQFKSANLMWGGKRLRALAVFRNGHQMDEPYIKEPMAMDIERAPYAIKSPLKLKADEYFVMGDNRNDSNDSQYWGPLEGSRIRMKVNSIVFPSAHARKFP